MIVPVVIFFVGNPSRGDDALGPELCGRLAVWLENAGLSSEVELIEDFQLQIEHALDLTGRRLALFVDAGVQTPGPFIFRAIEASTVTSHTTHALSPEAVLQVAQQLGGLVVQGEMMPPAFVLCVRGESFELGTPLTSSASAAADAALEFLKALCQQPTLSAWKTAQR